MEENQNAILVEKMNGNVILLLENHDKWYLKSVPHADKCVLSYMGKKFLLIHKRDKIIYWEAIDKEPVFR